MVWGLAAVAGAAFALTAVLRRYALAHRVLDIPNARSAHAVPTPRGGGMAIVASFLVALPLLAGAGWVPWALCWALFGAGAGIAALGFVDDHRPVAARWRLLGHAAAAAWLLVWLHGAPPLAVFGQLYRLPWLLDVLGMLYLVWLLNLYNFMDGLDGLASVEAICVCLGGALVQAAALHTTGGAAAGCGAAAGLILPLVLACAVAGFLAWNFPPARIFMGDAGSGFLGITLGGLSLHAGWLAPPLLWSWLILLGVFIVDATWTLLRRLLRGERLYEAHRSHAYQRAARRYASHRRVTLAVGSINLLWLWPLALLVGLGRLDGLVGLLIAYAPLLALAIGLQAGQREAGR